MQGQLITKLTPCYQSLPGKLVTWPSHDYNRSRSRCPSSVTIIARSRCTTWPLTILTCQDFNPDPAWILILYGKPCIWDPKVMIYIFHSFNSNRPRIRSWSSHAFHNILLNIKHNNTIIFFLDLSLWSSRPATTLKRDEMTSDLQRM